jgi:predicted MFS family arabinose efflux permease
MHYNARSGRTLVLVHRSDRSQWPLVAAGTALIGATYGLGRYAYGLNLPVLRRELGLGASTAGALAAVAYGAYCLALVAGGRIADRGTAAARAVAVAAGACTVAGTGAVALAGSTAALGAGVALGGLGSGLASPALAALLAARIDAGARERALTVVNAGTGLGVLVCGPAALVAADRWRVSFAAFAVLSAVVTVAVAAAAAGAAAAVAPPPPRELDGAAPRPWRDHAPLVLGALGLGAAGSAYWTFGRDVLAAAGAGDAGPAQWTVLGAASILGGVTGDAVARGRAGSLWAGLLVALAAGTAALALAPRSLPIALASAAAFGASFVALTGVLILWATRLQAQRPAAAVSGAFVLLSAGGVAGALVTGALIDRAGPVPAFLAAAGVALACAPLGYTPAARRALACAASSNASSSGSSGASRPSAVAISQSANQAFLGRSGPCR